MNQSKLKKRLKSIGRLCRVVMIVGLMLATLVIIAMLLDDLNFVSLIIMVIVFSFVVFLWVKTA